MAWGWTSGFFLLFSHALYSERERKLQTDLQSEDSRRRALPCRYALLYCSGCFGGWDERSFMAWAYDLLTWWVVHIWEPSRGGVVRILTVGGVDEH